MGAKADEQPAKGWRSGSGEMAMNRADRLARTDNRQQTTDAERQAQGRELGVNGLPDRVRRASEGGERPPNNGMQRRPRHGVLNVRPMPFAAPLMRVRWAPCPHSLKRAVVLARCLSRRASTPASSALRSLRPSLKAAPSRAPMTALERQRAAWLGFDAAGCHRCRAGASSGSIRWSLLQRRLIKGAALRRQPER
jgi:hypothetical protein